MHKDNAGVLTSASNSPFPFSSLSYCLSFVSYVLTDHFDNLYLNSSVYNYLSKELETPECTLRLLDEVLYSTYFKWLIFTVQKKYFKFLQVKL